MSKSRGKKARISTSSSDEVNGEEAAALKALLESGTGPLGGLTDAQVLRVLKADKLCEELYSKACKVRFWGRSRGAAAGTATVPPATWVAFLYLNACFVALAVSLLHTV